MTTEEVADEIVKLIESVSCYLPYKTFPKPNPEFDTLYLVSAATASQYCVRIADDDFLHYE